MNEAIFELETITPLFMAGADQATAEIRAPSFRGPMRYWQRALVGGLVGTDTEALRKVAIEENTVFGATDTGSVVRVRIPRQLPAQHKAQLPEFKRESYGRPGSGKDYLLWSMERSGGGPKPRKYFPTGTSFPLILSARGGNEAIFQKGIAAFWLLTHLGGIGARSRRCAGSLQVTGNSQLAGSIASFLFDIPEDPLALCTGLASGIQTARSLYGYAALPLKDANFDVLSSNTCRIWILLPGKKLWDTENLAMRYIGASLREYRASKPIQDRKIFGLPLTGVSGKRLSSPLLLRLTKLQGERYVGIAVVFKTNALGLKTSDYTLIEQWITQYFPNALEVEL